jgi:hypothetical protein
LCALSVFGGIFRTCGVEDRMIEVKRKRGRGTTQVLNDLKEKRGY